MNLRQLKGKTLSDYDMKSVFLELYHIEKMIEDGKHVKQKNYIMIRLVTIIEQFFRKVLEFLLRRYPDKRPQNIALDTQIINDILKAGFNRRWWHVTELIISHTFSFQNTKAIDDAMYECGKMRLFSDSKRYKLGDKSGLIMRDYDKLFEARHVIVHSVKWLPYLDVKRYYSMTENLLNYTLDKVKYYRFHEERDQALSQLQRIKADKHHIAAKKLHDNMLNKGEIATKLFKQGKYEESIIQDNEVLFLEPDDFAAHFSKGSSFFFLGKYREAVECYERHLELANDPGAYLYMGIALQKLGEHEDAIKCFGKAIEYGSDKVLTYINWATSLGNLKLLDDVLKYTGMVLAIEPENSIALDIKKITQEEIDRLNGNPPNAT